MPEKLRRHTSDEFGKSSGSGSPFAGLIVWLQVSPHIATPFGL